MLINNFLASIGVNFLSSPIESIRNAFNEYFNDIDIAISPHLPNNGHWALIAFFIYTLFVISGSLTAVLARNLVRALVGLILTFLGVSGMYLLMNSSFLAFMQLLIYGGAVCVLIFFSLMFTRSTSSGEEAARPSLINLIYGILSFLATIVLIAPILLVNSSNIALKVPLETPTEKLGQGLLESYVVPFELISIILLIAMAGGVLLAWDGKWKKK